MSERILKEVLSELVPPKEEINRVSSVVKIFLKELNVMLKRARANATPFIGGSFAKNTMLKKTPYEVDVFLRFKQAEGMKERMDAILRELKKNKKYKYSVVHGSRDYLQLTVAGESGVMIEIIPVLHIQRAQQAQNITDLSAFHVAYMLKKIKKLEDQVRLAKAFCAANGVYGAESYISGFSGYALEGLIVYYKSFMKMLRSLSKAEKPIVIDPARHYKNSQEALLLMNESKVKGPIVLVDPTYKERNALAALSEDSFAMFQKAAKAFLSRPSASFFEKKSTNPAALKERAHKQKAEFVHVRIETDRQAGDIAGTKLKKFHYALEEAIAKEFDLLEHHFVYSGAQHADVYIIAKSNKEKIVQGPPAHMEEHVRAFKKMHKDTFVKKNILYARAKPMHSCNAFCKEFAKKDIVKQMGVTKLEVL